MTLKSVRGKLPILGPLTELQLPLTLDPVVYEGAIVYAEDGKLKVSNGTLWNDIGAGIQGTQGTTGFQGPQGTQGLVGASIIIIGSIATVGGSPQVALNAAFPGASTNDGVLDELTQNLWVYDGVVWINVGQVKGPQGTQGLSGDLGIQGLNGEDGIQGERGFPGIQGTQGTQGAQ
jgi:hypothetical protein